ncbi:MAG: flavin reductase [Candidatus Marinimicrobia bacterium]|nr:flavin reductase [Candidatus Neomarinimicrobiota bacterium]
MDQKEKSDVLKMFTYGMFVLTSKSGKDISASTVTWVTQTSFTPPLIGVSLKVGSGPYEVVKDSGKFVLHIVPRDGKLLVSKFFRRAQIEDETLNGIPFGIDESTDLPVLEEFPAHLICEVREIAEVGDHHMVIAEIIDAKLREKAEPILLRETGWNYGG